MSLLRRLFVPCRNCIHGEVFQRGMDLVHHRHDQREAGILFSTTSVPTSCRPISSGLAAFFLGRAQALAPDRRGALHP